jgi:hypothetical protein
VGSLARPSFAQFCADHHVPEAHMRAVIAKYHAGKEWEDLPLDTIIDLGRRVDVGYAWMNSTDAEGKKRTDVGLKAALAAVFDISPATASLFALDARQFGFLWEIYQSDPREFADVLCDPTTSRLWRAQNEAPMA